MAIIKNARDIALQATAPRVVYPATNNLSIAELNTIRGRWDDIVAERASINSQSLTYSVSSTAYNNAIVDLGTFLNGSAWTTGIPQYITPTYIGGVTTSGLEISLTTGADFRAKASTFELARTAVFQGISDAAAAKGVAAQASADGANNWLVNALSDSVLTVSELQAIRSWWDATIAEQTSINGQVTAFSLTTLGTAYTAAIYNLGFFMNGNLAWTVGTIPSYIATSYINSATLATIGLNLGATTGSSLRTLVAAFGVARTAIFNAAANSAATTANYGSISSIPTNIITAGQSPTTSLLNSGISISASGALSGGGGGSVTIAGLGYSGALNATANQSDTTTNNSIATKLTNGVANVLSSGTALKTTNYDTGNGLVITNTGIAAKKGGVSTFAIGSDGTATFTGIITGSNGQFTNPIVVPSFNATYAVSVVGTTGAYGVFGSGTKGGVYGQSAASGAWAVTADNPYGGTSLYTTSNAAIASGGLDCSGGLRMGTSGDITFVSTLAKIIFPAGAPICPNLNANYLSGTAINNICTVVPTDNGTCSIAGAGFNLNGAPTTGIAGAYVTTYGGGNSVQIKIQTTAPSDRRIKSNVESIDYGLDFVNKLRPISYTLNSDPKQQTGFGFISQEVQELTGNNESSLSYYDEELENGDIKGLNVIHYPSYIAVLTKAIQELSQELQALKKEIKR